MPRRSFPEAGERAPPWVGDPKCTPPPFHGSSRPPAGASRCRACKCHRLTRKRRLPTGKARWQTCKRRRQPCRPRWQAWKPRLPTGKSRLPNRKRHLQARKTLKNSPFPPRTPVLAPFGPSPPSAAPRPIPEASRTRDARSSESTINPLGVHRPKNRRQIAAVVSVALASNYLSPG